MTSYQHHGAGPLSRRLVLGLLGSIPVAAGVAVATGGSAQASTAGCGQPPVPPPKALQPGGTYDQQLARLAAQDQFSGTVLLAYQDKPVLARAYAMADKADPDIARPYSRSAPGGPRTDVIGEEDFIGSPAGNAFSTAPDMVRFARALTGGRLLSPAYADLMTSGKVPLPRQRIPSQLNMTGYGPDIRIVNDRTVFGHTGGAAGETTDIDIYPGLDWVAVILSNYDSSNQVGSLIQLHDQLIT